MRRFRLILIAAGLMSGLPSRAEMELRDAIDVVVNVGIVTRYQVYDGVSQFVDQVQKQYRNDPVMLKKKVEALEVDVREGLVEDQLILHEFNTAGYSMPESVIDDFVQQRIRSRYSDRATLTKTLQAKGDTYERYRRRVRDQFIIGQMKLKTVSDAVIISPHKIETYYTTHTNEFGIGERVKMRMIVLNKAADDPDHARKLGEEIIVKVNEGAAFAEMAKSFSEGMHSREGGDWGWVERLNTEGVPVLRKELDEAVFSLKAGERSGVIDTPEACYLVLVEEKSPGHIKPLSEVRDEIEARLLTQEQDRLNKQWIERLKKKTFVRYFMNAPAGGTQ